MRYASGRRSAACAEKKFAKSVNVLRPHYRSSEKSCGVVTSRATHHVACRAAAEPPCLRVR